MKSVQSMYKNYLNEISNNDIYKLDSWTKQRVSIQQNKDIGQYGKYAQFSWKLINKCLLFKYLVLSLPLSPSLPIYTLDTGRLAGCLSINCMLGIYYEKCVLCVFIVVRIFEHTQTKWMKITQYFPIRFVMVAKCTHLCTRA